MGWGLGTVGLMWLTFPTVGLLSPRRDDGHASIPDPSFIFILPLESNDGYDIDYLLDLRYLREALLEPDA